VTTSKAYQVFNKLNSKSTWLSNIMPNINDSPINYHVDYCVMVL
jgi:hypothetical protein